MPGHLTLCATPIGNLGDASPRLAEAMAAASIIYAEDTRRSRRLLDALGIDRPLRSYFAGNEDERAVELEGRLAAGETVCLVTDAGTPAISDPGLSAVRAALAAGAGISVVPGPSAVTAALAVSGLPSDRFVFEGFLPRRGGDRQERLAAIAAEARTVVLFSAPSRVAADLSDLAETCGGERPVVVARELTKVFEEVWRGTLAGAAATWTEVAARGEFTLVVGAAPPVPPDLPAAVARVGRLVEEGGSFRDAVRRVATETGIGRRELYEAARPRT